jgi:SNF2 family DNA or RNA helicase
VAVIELDPEDQERVTITHGLVEEYLVKQLPGVLHDRGRSGHNRVVHTAPNTWATWMAVQGVFYGQLPEMGPRWTAYLDREWRERVEPCLNLRLQTNVLQDPHTPWDDELYPFQRAGVAFMTLAGQALLGDEMGAGKTPQAILTLRRLHAYGIDVFPVCCVVPNSTKRPWRREWHKWFPDARVSVVGGTPTERRRALEAEAEVYVIHWEAVQLHSRVMGYGDIRLKKCKECDKKSGDPKLAVSRCETHRKELNQIEFKSVIVDEAHMMKNASAKRTRAVWAIQWGKHVRFRYSLTGTPIADNPGDLWPIMRGLHPTEYPTFTSYVQRYCMITWNYSGEQVISGINPNTRTEFFGFFDARFRRMPKALVLPHLPPFVYEQRDCPMSKKQEIAYKQMKQHLMAEVNDGEEILVAQNNLAKNTRLVQFASALCEYDPVMNEVTMIDSQKIPELIQIIEDAGKPLVVCAESRKLIDLASQKLEEKKIPHELLVGGMTDDGRDNALMAFQAGRVKVLLFTMKAGGTGLNMTAADTLVRMDRSWSMLINYQTLNRVHRIGSEIHNSITIVDLVAPGTVEERQFQVLGERMARLEEIVRDKLTLRQLGRLAEISALENEERVILNSTLLP